MSKVAANMKRIQYKTNDGTPSSLTIDETIFNALDKKFGNANVWCQNKAREVRAELEMEAINLMKDGLLTKRDSKGNNEKMLVNEYVKGKVSSGVRHAVHLEVIDQSFL